MINIAIDGPSGAGKSTIGKMLAKRLGITYLDTGAMYRAVALYVVRKGVSPLDEEAVVPLLDEIELSFSDTPERNIMLNGEDVSTAIREHAISKAASDVSKIPAVRLFLVAMQRKIAAESDVVLDGRDITSDYDTVLADIKDRDHNDSHRAFAPLTKTEDSVLIDSTDMTADQVAEVITDYVLGKKKKGQE